MNLFLTILGKAVDQNSFLKVHHIIDCLVNEYENAKGEETIESYRLQHLIIPHLEIIANVCEEITQTF